MTEPHSADDLRKKAHEINCELSEQDFSPREIEIIGYYLNRIAASYLSYLTHRELAETDIKKPTKEFNIKSTKSW